MGSKTHNQLLWEQLHNTASHPPSAAPPEHGLPPSDHVDTSSIKDCGAARASSQSTCEATGEQVAKEALLSQAGVAGLPAALLPRVLAGCVDELD